MRFQADLGLCYAASFFLMRCAVILSGTAAKALGEAMRFHPEGGRLRLTEGPTCLLSLPPCLYEGSETTEGVLLT
jgi:hypothetical protein